MLLDKDNLGNMYHSCCTKAGACLQSSISKLYSNTAVSDRGPHLDTSTGTDFQDQCWWGCLCSTKRDDAWIVSQIRSSRRESSWYILVLKKGQKGLCCTGVALATEPPMPKLERVAQIRKSMLSRCKGYPVCSYLFPSGAPIYIHFCARVGAPLFYPLGH